MPRRTPARFATQQRLFSLVLLMVVAPTAACGAGANRFREEDPADRQRIRHDGRDRSYIVRVPTAAAQRQARIPLVIILHGGGGNARIAETMTGFTEKARAEGFIVA